MRTILLISTLLIALPLQARDRPVIAVTTGACIEGKAGDYPCRNVDLLAFVPLSELGTPAPATVNDVWGWADPETNREYALLGASIGIIFVDVTEPAQPRVIGRLLTRTIDSLWRSVKVYRNHAYVVADRADVHGVQVFDLTQLRAAKPFTTFRATAEYFGTGYGLAIGQVVASAHNVAINEESGFAYVVGAHGTCAAGLHMVDIREPARPRFAGCFAADGYTHDVKCVNYRGPDPTYANREICLASNEDTVTIVDVTEKRRPKMISRTSYPGAAYTHQGWLTEDQAYFVVNDELDERNRNHATRTILFDVRDLDRPLFIGEYFAATKSIDHNLYVHQGLVYEANYTSGLRILDGAEIPAGRLTEVAFFDVDPKDDDPAFRGAWNVYPFFRSGVVVVSSIHEGLFVLQPTLRRK